MVRLNELPKDDIVLRIKNILKNKIETDLLKFEVFANNSKLKGSNKVDRHLNLRESKSLKLKCIKGNIIIS